MTKTKSNKSPKVPYDKLSDDQKVRKNWKKAVGLFERKEWSVVILRCGTCLELALNFAIREELVSTRNLPLEFVDKLLRNANGIHNKYQNIYLPIMEEYDEGKDLKALWSESISPVNRERNAVAHRGEFRGKKKAEELMNHTYKVLIELFKLHSSEEKLKKFET